MRFRTITRLPILLALCVAPALANAGTDASAGTVRGLVRFDGEIPRQEIPDNEGRIRPLLRVDEASRGLAYVVVSLTPLDREIRPAADGMSDDVVRIRQEGFEFVPRVVALRPGQTIAIGNDDVANHNVRSVARNPENSFNVMTPSGEDYEKRLYGEADDRPIRLACDIHPWMTGWIYIFDHNWFTVSDERGRFTIANVPPGRYTLALRQPDGRLNATMDIGVAAGDSLDVAASFTSGNLAGKQPGKIELLGEAPVD